MFAVCLGEQYGLRTSFSLPIGLFHQIHVMDVLLFTKNILTILTFFFICLNIFFSISWWHVVKFDLPSPHLEMHQQLVYPLEVPEVIRFFI